MHNGVLRDIKFKNKNNKQQVHYNQQNHPSKERLVNFARGRAHFVSTVYYIIRLCLKSQRKKGISITCTIVMLIQIYFQKEDCVSVVEEGRVQLEQCGDTPAPISYHSTGHLIELR